MSIMKIKKKLIEIISISKGINESPMSKPHILWYDRGEKFGAGVRRRKTTPGNVPRMPAGRK